MIGDGIVARAGIDDIRAAGAIDRVVAGAAGDGVRSSRTGNRQARGHSRRIDVLEIGDVGRIAAGLIGIAQVHRRGRAQNQRVGAGAAVDRGFRSVIGDSIVACAGRNDIGAARTIDGVVAGTAGDHVGARRAGDGHRRGDSRRVDVLEIGDRSSTERQLVGVREIEDDRCIQDQRIGAGAAIDGGLRAVIGNGIIAGAGADDVRAAATIDDVVAGAGRDGVRARRARHRQRGREDTGVYALEICDIDGVARRLIGAGRNRQIDRRDAARRGKHQHIGSGAAIDRGFRAAIGDRIVARTGIDGIRAARSIDRIVARAARDRVGGRGTRDRDGRCNKRRIDIQEVGDVDRVAGGLVGVAEVDRGRSMQLQGIGSGSTVDGGFRTIIGDRIVAGAAAQGVGATAAVDRVVAAAAGNDVDAARARDRNAGRESRRVDVLEVGDRDEIARRLVGIGKIDRRDRLHHQRVGAGAAIDRRFRAVIGNSVVASTGRDVVGAAVAVDNVVARSGRDVVSAGRAGKGDGGREAAGVEIFKVRYRHRIADGLIRAGGDAEIDGSDSAARGQNERIGARAAIDRHFRAAIGDDVVASAGVDDIRTAAAVDGIDTAAGDDGVGRRRSRHGQRVADRARIQVLEVLHGDAVATRDIRARRRGQIDAGQTGHRAHDQGIVAGVAVDGDFRSPIVDRVVAGAGIDHVGAGIALNDVVAGTGGDGVGGGRTDDR